MTEIDAIVILAFARCSMNANETARKLAYNHNSIHYHLNKVKDHTGLDPRNFFDLHELYQMATGILGEDFDI